MRTLPTMMIRVLAPFAPLFSNCVFQHVQLLLTGLILAPGKRTVASALRAVGLDKEKRFCRYHRVLSRASWSSREASRLLLGLLVETFVPDGPLVVGVDETLERRQGKKIAAKGIYRDPVRSSHSHVVKTSALRWVCLTLLTPIPWASRVWALPFLSVLAPSERYAKERGKRHKKLTEWAWQLLLQVRRWQPEREIVAVADGGYSSLELLDRCRRLSKPITFITRLRLDAALYNITFFVLTYAIAWGFVPFGSFGAFAPQVAALIVIPITQGVAGLKELGLRMIRWRVRWYWYAVAIGLPLAVHLAIVGLNVAAGAGLPSLTFTSLTTFLMVFAIRLVNPTDGPLGEHPGWNGVALPGLQGLGYSPPLATAILAPLVSLWHLPLFFWEPGGCQPSVLVSGLVVTIAVTFWYTWLFNHTRGSILLLVIAHDIEGSIQYELGWIVMGVWLAVAIGLVVFDWKAWRGPAPAAATTVPSVPPTPREAAPATPA